MDRKIRVAAIGDNCIDYYDSLNESYPGGNPVNVAVYIKRLGGESSYTGAVGTDSFGKIMISAIQNKESILLIFKCWMEKPQLHMLTL